jgi:tetratricopeptide (TPR) repeat protein
VHPPSGEVEARDLDQKGLDAYNGGDYESAADFFQKALDKLPNNSTIQEHLQNAKDQIAYQTALKKQKADEDFNRDKQKALGQLKGISNGGDFDPGTGLKGVGSTDSGLKDAPNSGDSSELKTLPEVNTDPRVVDARKVPTGLPKSVEDSIPHTPAGDRVRKGFQAIQAHDWKVALAWFQDALNHEPGDPSLKRLVDLAKFTLDYRMRTYKQVTENNYTRAQTKQLPSRAQTIKATDSSLVKPADDIEHVDFLTYEGAVMIAARARAKAVSDDFDKKYGNRVDVAARSAAISKALRGEGYSKEELNTDFQKALAVVYKLRRDRQANAKEGADRVGLKNNPLTPTRSYPDSPWGTVLRLLDNDPKQPNVYLGPTPDEIAMSGKG